VIDRLIKTAVQSNGKYCVGAVALDRKGGVLGYASALVDDRARRRRSLCAERRLMIVFRGVVDRIYVCRTNRSGSRLLPITVCERCAAMAAKYGVTIVTLG